MQRIANPSTSVRFRLAPPNVSHGLERGRPTPGKPVIVAAGMQGERASVVFAAPAEINSFIKQSACGRWRSEEIIPESDSANTSLRCLRTWSEQGTNTTSRGVTYRYKGMTGYPKRTFTHDQPAGFSTVSRTTPSPTSSERGKHASA